jgi:hypothetical protein
MVAQTISENHFLKEFLMAGSAHISACLAFGAKRPNAKRLLPKNGW